MFVRVQEEELVVGTKYKISEIYQVKYIYYGIYTGLWMDEYLLGFEKIYDVIKKEKCRTKMCFVYHLYRYYAFISDQPQWKMERRAVNLIVRRLIGDDNFEW